MDQRGGTDEQTNIQKITPFYKTLSPIEAAAKKRISCLKAPNGHSLALFLFISLHLPLGSRAAAPIGDEVLENGEEFLTSIHPFVHPPICPWVRPSIHLAGSVAWLTGPEAWMACPKAQLVGHEARLVSPKAWLVGWP